MSQTSEGGDCARLAHRDFGCRRVAEINTGVIKLGTRDPMSRIRHARSERDAIAVWRLELNRILHVFNVRFIASLLISLTIYFQAELVVNTLAADPNTQNVASENNSIVAEVPGSGNLSVRNYLIHSGGTRCFTSFQDLPGYDPPLTLSGVFAQAIATSPIVPYNLLRQIDDLDKNSPQFPQQLSDFLCGAEYRDLVSGLQSRDLASLAEYLDSVRHQTIFLRIALNATLGSRQYFRSHEPRVSGVLARTKEDMWC